MVPTRRYTSTRIQTPVLFVYSFWDLLVWNWELDMQFLEKYSSFSLMVCQDLDMSKVLFLCHLKCTISLHECLHEIFSLGEVQFLLHISHVVQEWGCFLSELYLYGIGGLSLCFNFAIPSIVHNCCIRFAPFWGDV